jgi:HK97 family phage portal protein
MFLRRLLNRATKSERPGSSRSFYVPQKQAGVNVTHDTALTFSGYYAGIRTIAESIAMLPWQVYRKTPESGRERQPNSMVEYLLNRRPNPEMTAFSFRETLIAHAIGWGNGYAEIERDMARRPTGLWPLPPDRVEVMRDSETGQLFYRVRSERGGTVDLDPFDVLHLHGLGWDGLTGYSLVSLAARTIGGGMAAEDYANAFFGNAVVASGSITVPVGVTVTEDSRKLLKDELSEKATGKRAFSPLFLPSGIEWKAMSLPAQDAQLIEQRKFSVTEMARWLRIPPHKLMDLDRSTNNNIEHQGKEFVYDALMPWAVRLEQEIDYKLFGMNNNVNYTKFNFRALLRGDAQSRGQYYRELRNLGVINANEIREWEDMDPIGEEGDKYVMQVNMTTLERIGEEPTNEGTQDDPEQTRQAARIRAV